MLDYFAFSVVIVGNTGTIQSLNCHIFKNNIIYIINFHITFFMLWYHIGLYLSRLDQLVSSEFRVPNDHLCRCVYVCYRILFPVAVFHRGF